MTRWQDLTKNEKTALRKLAKGELHEVSALMIHRLVVLGLTDGSPDGRLTPAGLELIELRQSLPAALQEKMNDRTSPGSAPSRIARREPMASPSSRAV